MIQDFLLYWKNGLYAFMNTESTRAFELIYIKFFFSMIQMQFLYFQIVSDWVYHVGEIFILGYHPVINSFIILKERL